MKRRIIGDTVFGDSDLGVSGRLSLRPMELQRTLQAISLYHCYIPLLHTAPSLLSSLLLLPYHSFHSFHSFRTTPSVPLLPCHCFFTNINFFTTTSSPPLLYHYFFTTTASPLRLYHYFFTTTSLLQSPLLLYRQSPIATTISPFWRYCSHILLPTARPFEPSDGVTSK